MKCALISVGTELVIGQTVNTNVTYLSQQLNLLGIDVMYHITVGDNPKRLRDYIDEAKKDCDLIITTGGLGPTQDDLTKEIATEAFEDELVFDDSVWDEIVKMFEDMDIEMTENNKKQAYVPSRSFVFHNDQGTAPGFILENQGKYISCIPGPPREMRAMFEKSLQPYLQELAETGILYVRDVRVYNIGESSLETEVMDLIEKQTDPTIATYAMETEAYIRVASKRKTEDEARAAVEEVIAEIRNRIGDNIYSEDGEEIKEVVARLLVEKGRSISSAESCTGGMFASALIEYPGISKVFDRGLVTYSNRAKMEELGVPEETLKRYGAVSEETARAMCDGLYDVTGSDICISVTGVAGPDGGTEKTPVGLSYIGIRYDGETRVIKRLMREVNRNWNRNRITNDMLFLVYNIVK